MEASSQCISILSLQHFLAHTIGQIKEHRFYSISICLIDCDQLLVYHSAVGNDLVDLYLYVKVRGKDGIEQLLQVDQTWWWVNKMQIAKQFGDEWRING